MKIEEIDTVCFIGAGTMGCFNALMAAAAGYDAVLYDLSEEALVEAPLTLTDMAAALVEAGFFAAQDIPAAMSRIRVNSDLAAATANADLVSESVSERLEVKRAVFKQLDELCPQGAILTTNTSALLVSDIEDAVKRGDRFAALHSHLGSHLLDIVGGPRTSAETIDILQRYVMSIHGVPLVLKKEHPGYVLNTMLGSMLAMAMVLVIEGVASKEDIDRAWMSYRKAPMGPFGMMDLFGLNVVYDSWQKPNPEAEASGLKDKIIAFLFSYISRSALGVKTDEGFYHYPEPAFQQDDFLQTSNDLSLPYYAMIGVIIDNATNVARKGVANIEDIDRAWMVGTHAEIGPFGIVDALGIDEFLAIYSAQVELGLFSKESADLLKSFMQPYIDKQQLGEKSGQGFYTYPKPRFRQPGFLPA
ncbi:MAG: 3-hydroxyacyl-CoA dehydrogenase NAD-binding domain-containing protein [Pseudomonadales bacterium]